MLNRTQQILVAIVAVAVLGMLWFAGNDRRDDVGGPEPAAPADASAAEPAPASAPAPASVARGVPHDGTLEPISIDPDRPADRLPQIQASAMLDDYRNSPDAANERYVGKYLIVEGVASGIRREGDQVFVDIRTNDPGVNVRALLLQRQICGPAGRVCEVEARATMVRRGQKVALECNGAGLADGTPLLRDCLLRGGAN